MRIRDVPLPKRFQEKFKFTGCCFGTVIGFRYHMAVRITLRPASISETPPGVHQGESGSSSHPRRWRWLQWPLWVAWPLLEGAGGELHPLHPSFHAARAPEWLCHIWSKPCLWSPVDGNKIIVKTASFHFCHSSINILKYSKYFLYLFYHSVGFGYTFPQVNGLMSQSVMGEPFYPLCVSLIRHRRHHVVSRLSCCLKMTNTIHNTLSDA